MGDVLKQAGWLLHNTGRNPVQILIVNCCTQAVAPGGFRKVGGYDNIDRIFIANFLLLIVETVIGEKFEAF